MGGVKIIYILAFHDMIRTKHLILHPTKRVGCFSAVQLKRAPFKAVSRAIQRHRSAVRRSNRSRPRLRILQSSPTSPTLTLTRAFATYLPINFFLPSFESLCPLSKAFKYYTTINRMQTWKKKEIKNFFKNLKKISLRIIAFNLQLQKLKSAGWWNVSTWFLCALCRVQIRKGQQNAVTHTLIIQIIKKTTTLKWFTLNTHTCFH